MVTTTQLGSCLEGYTSRQCPWTLIVFDYVNDMPLQIQHGSLLQYADDSCLICCIRRSTQSVILPPIYVGGYSLECVDTQKYLDLHIDFKLSWRSRVASVCKKMAYYPALFDWILPKYFSECRLGFQWLPLDLLFSTMF